MIRLEITHPRIQVNISPVIWQKKHHAHGWMAKLEIISNCWKYYQILFAVFSLFRYVCIAQSNVKSSNIITDPIKSTLAVTLSARFRTYITPPPWEKFHLDLRLIFSPPCLLIRTDLPKFPNNQLLARYYIIESRGSCYSSPCCEGAPSSYSPLTNVYIYTTVLITFTHFLSPAIASLCSSFPYVCRRVPLNVSFILPWG